jgi:hypothetical protein
MRPTAEPMFGRLHLRRSQSCRDGKLRSAYPLCLIALPHVWRQVNNLGNLATLAAILRASSRVSNFAADLRLAPLAARCSRRVYFYNTPYVSCG